MRPRLLQTLRALALFLLGLASASASFPFAEATVAGLQQKMAAGELSAEALTQAYLDRIAAVDKAGPALNAVLEVNPDALAQARALDAERKAGKVRGALHGIPVLIKDNLATADKMETTAGSLALVGARPPRDSVVVKQLREAGAVILGKTNLSEWANMRGEHSVSGWSGRGGQTRNPYALDRNPSGSSSGTAAAVSANLCVVGIGSETDGSIVSPGSVCGLVGFKPTVGLVSRTGIIPISFSQDTAGPMARNVRDAAALLEAISSADPADSATLSRPPGLKTDFVAQLAPNSLRGARLGLLHGPYWGLDPRLLALQNEAVAALKNAGAEVIELSEKPDFDAAGPAEMEVLLYELKDGLNAYFATLGPASPIKSLADVIAFNKDHASRELALFGQEHLVNSQAKGPLTDKAYLDARALCLKTLRTEGIDALVAKHHLDALISLTNGTAWLIDPVNGDAYSGGSSTLAAVAGYPSVTVPAGQYKGLPVGLSFYGLAWTDGKILSLAADFEAVTHARREPSFSPSAGAF